MPVKWPLIVEPDLVTESATSASTEPGGSASGGATLLPGPVVNRQFETSVASARPLNASCRRTTRRRR
jgi:hypothetical protein